MGRFLGKFTELTSSRAPAVRDQRPLVADPAHARLSQRKSQPRRRPRLHPVRLRRRLAAGEVSERQIIDHPWVQRLRQIHQLQTAWWVFPTAEHTRFQHVLGVMHLASRAVAALYDSLREVCPDVPSRGYVESLVRMAGLLHDVGHGPFGHFFDDHFLAGFGLTHETLGSTIICDELGDLLRRIRRNPNSRLADGEQLDPRQIALLITRPKPATTADAPRWLRLLRSLFSGIYTVDNMDFVLRDAYMSGYNARAFDLDRLLHYSFFSPQGLTIHSRGMAALVQFIERAGRPVSHDLFSSHGAGHRPDAGRPVRRQQAAICFPAIRWSTWTSIAASPSGRCWSTSPAGTKATTRASASWASAGRRS